ncbi:hypothetical protein KXX53_003142 [Aspergillus fumigatus]|nr:hypothetical protein KXX53_003142 [Aspergillus fumigatus]
MVASDRLKKVADSLSSNPISASVLPDTMSSRVQVPDRLPWDPSCTRFPSRKELPTLTGAPEGAAWVWGREHVHFWVFHPPTSASASIICFWSAV